jgi:hypothetical protein
MFVFILLWLSASLTGCFGIKGNASIGSNSKFEGIGKDKGRMDVMVSILNASGEPVANKRVTLVTSRNETRTALTIGPDDSDIPQSFGVCLFAGVRGDIQSLTVFVGGYPFLFSELDMYKGWDEENNVINLVVYMRDGQTTGMDSRAASVLLQRQASGPGE